LDFIAFYWSVSLVGRVIERNVCPGPLQTKRGINSLVALLIPSVGLPNGQNHQKTVWRSALLLILLFRRICPMDLFRSTYFDYRRWR